MTGTAARIQARLFGFLLAMILDQCSLDIWLRTQYSLSAHWALGRKGEAPVKNCDCEYIRRGEPITAEGGASVLNAQKISHARKDIP